MTSVTRSPRVARRRLPALAAVLVIAAAATLALLSAPPARAGGEAKPVMSTKDVKLKRNQAWVAPQWADYGVATIAFAPVTSVSRDTEAERLTRQAVEAAFAGAKFKAMGQGFFMDLVRKNGVEPAFNTMQGNVLAGAALDTAAVRQVAEKVGAQAVLFTHVTTWQRQVVDPNARGQSFTQVGAEMAMFSLRDGALLWRGSFQEKGDGPFNDPAANEATERDPSGIRTTNQSRLEPPTYVEVLDKMMERAAAALPKPAAPAAPATPAAP
jgi:hypothetical protein